MFATRTTADCTHCGTSAAECQTRNLTGEPGRCCRRCRFTPRSHRERTVRRELPEPPPPPPATSVRPSEVLDRAGEDELVGAILRAAELEDVAAVDGSIERFDQPGVAAYRSLAQSRGLDLETVARHAVRGELRAVVQMPIATDEPPPPATAGPDSTPSEGDHDAT